MSPEAITALWNITAPAALRALLNLASPELAALLAGTGLLVAIWGLYRLMGPSWVQRRLRKYVPSVKGMGMAPSGEDRPDSPMIMEVLNRRMARRRTAASLRMRLLRAGLSLTVVEFLAIRIVAALLVAVAVGIALALQMGLLAVPAAAVAALVGSYIPSVVVSVRAKRRMAAVESQLPDALDLLATSLQAGTGLAQGLEVLAREMPAPISSELRLTLQEIQFGLSMREALTNLSNRVFSEDLDLVVTSIIIQGRVGGNLVHILRTTSNAVRDRIRMKGEIKVLTAQQRLSSIIITIIPPGVAGLLFMLSPDYMKGLLEPGLPRYMLVAAVAMQITGMLIINKITQIES